MKIRTPLIVNSRSSRGNVTMPLARMKGARLGRRRELDMRGERAQPVWVPASRQ
jgi:hypothetical protein